MSIDFKARYFPLNEEPDKRYYLRNGRVYDLTKWSDTPLDLEWDVQPERYSNVIMWDQTTDEVLWAMYNLSPEGDMSADGIEVVPYSLPDPPAGEDHSYAIGVFLSDKRWATSKKPARYVSELHNQADGGVVFLGRVPARKVSMNQRGRGAREKSDKKRPVSTKRGQKETLTTEQIAAAVAAAVAAVTGKDTQPRTSRGSKNTEPTGRAKSKKVSLESLTPGVKSRSQKKREKAGKAEREDRDEWEGRSPKTRKTKERDEGWGKRPTKYFDWETDRERMSLPVTAPRKKAETNPQPGAFGPAPTPARAPAPAPVIPVSPAPVPVAEPGRKGLAFFPPVNVKPLVEYRSITRHELRPIKEERSYDITRWTDRPLHARPGSNVPQKYYHIVMWNNAVDDDASVLWAQYNVAVDGSDHGNTIVEYRKPILKPGQVTKITIMLLFSDRRWPTNKDPLEAVNIRGGDTPTQFLNFYAAAGNKGR